ncbi:hypothetical protein FT663_04393 [Candidozyma haemuli var. vulneris]|uniref:FYVE-type domain-containing protein n=1 Tax=Candidozyma haemuli TaxID=45357 RepID=A0A2V1ATV2_9ASCO|nr:hypothetical protein CXQ85_000161 [[Candida] haemuloni]KAF3987576.1 hypothetical protein FT663_04393 [[Candida] haemuloni var. vulneris]KAF3988898.1 hypothetical protein FT662_03131 [[Candida] haemuloni var. vulneris]PVH21194.1 hypothetical protein CXQ85_000161 [[Candida] haemuloni]
MGASTVATTEEPPLTEIDTDSSEPKPLPRNGSDTYDDYKQDYVSDTRKNHEQHDITTDNGHHMDKAEDEGKQSSHDNQSPAESNTGSTTPVEPNDGDDDAKQEYTNDLQFKKKDLKKPRTQSFQSVLSTASLKSLRQADVNNPPPLQRNSSNLGNSTQTGTGNHKNFQSFIQAPVLSSVSNLRALDNIVIGQQLPFDHKDAPAESESNRSRHNSNVTQTTSQPPVKDERDDDDEYREETILQQQKLTLNALKKLSLSLAPIIRSDEETGPESRQLTTKSLNGSLRPESKLEQRKEESKDKVTQAENKAKPYQPAQVDLSSFASLTRQNKHLPDAKNLQLQPKQTSDQQQQPAAPNPSERDYHMDMQRQMLNMQSQAVGNEPAQKLLGQASLIKPAFGSINDNSIKENTQQSQSAFGSLNQGLRSQKLQQSQSQVLTNAPHGQQLAHSQSHGQIQREKSETELNPVLPPLDMNVRNRKTSQADDTPSKHISLTDKRIQQIKGFRNPMYIPAVLRKTLDQDADLGPLSSGSVGESGRESYFEGLSRVGSPSRELGSSSNSVRSVDSADNSITSPSIAYTGPYTLNKKQYEHILRAAPTRKHWLKDEAVSQCGISSCRKHFNFFERRHHCRRCGGIFCKEHTSHYLYINHLAQFTTGGRGTLSRVCDNCIEEYNDFMKQEFGVSCHRPRSSIDVNATPAIEEREREAPPPTNKPVASPRKELLKHKNPPTRQRNQIPQQVQIAKGLARDEQSNEQIAGSVPANWSWSSF